MALQVWLPLNGNLNNQGLSNLTFSINNSSNTIIDNSGKIGKCYSNNSFSAGGLLSNTTINLGTNQSMFCWFKFTNLTNSSSLGGAMITQHRYPKNTGMGLTIKYVSSTTGYLSINTGNGSSRTYNTYCGTTLLQANTWYHGGYTYDGTTIKLYLNGVCEKEVSYSGMSTPTDYIAVYCWAFNGNSGTGIEQNYRLNGSLNDVRIYDHALSAKEVEVLSRGLVCHYPLNGGGRGGDNLLHHTNIDKYGLGYMSTYASGTVTVDTTETFGSKSTIRVQPSSSTTSSGGFNPYNSTVNLTANTTYCYSCWIKSTVDDTFSFNSLGHFQTYVSGAAHNRTINHEGDTIPANKWTRVHIVFTPTVNCQFYSYFIYFANTSQKIWIADVKLELGDHPTSWMPSSADDEYSAMGYDSTTEYDVSGYGNNGTKTGTIAYSSDTAKYSVCTEFSKAGYIINNSFGLTTNAFTLNLWYKPKTATSQHFLLGTFDSWTGNGLGLYRDANKLNVQGVIKTSGTAYQSGVIATTLNTWQMLTYTYDGTNYKGYLNGVLKFTNACTGTVSHPVFMIGNSKFSNTAASENEEGFVSDVRLYATALSATQIAELYNTAVSVANNGALLGYELVEV